MHFESFYCKEEKINQKFLFFFLFFLFFFGFWLQPTDESENDGHNNSIEDESLKGNKKRENENLNGKTKEQPSKKRKEDPGSHFETKKPSPTKNKVANFVL